MRKSAPILLMVFVCSCANTPVGSRAPSSASTQTCLDIAGHIFHGDFKALPLLGKYEKAVMADIPKAYELVKAHPDPHAAFDSLKNKTLSFEEGLGLFISHLEKKQAFNVMESLLEMNIRVRSLKAPGGSLFRFGSKDFRGRTVLYWDNPILRTEDDLERFLGTFLEVYSKQKIPRISVNSLIRWGVKKDHLEVLREDMFAKLRFHEQKGIFTPGSQENSKLHKVGDNVLNFLGITKATELRRNFPTPEMVKAYARGDHQEVFNIIKKREGLSLALKHSFRVWEGVTGAIGVAVAVYVGSEFYKAKMEFYDANGIRFESGEEAEQARRVLEDMQAESAQLLERLQQEEGLSQEDREFIESLREEVAEL